MQRPIAQTLGHPLDVTTRSDPLVRRALTNTITHWHREAIAGAIVLGSCLIAAASADAAALSSHPIAAV
jgi:ADP-ribosylglycohydrolase